MSALHVEVIGRGEPLVLLHGWAMHGGIFRPLSERLAGHFTLHVVDLPGHGHSGLPPQGLALDACIDQLLAQLPVAAWLGWSLGGLLALRAAQRAPQRVTALIELCASPRFVHDEDWPHAVAADVFHTFGRDLARDYRGTIDRFVALEAHGSDHMREELRELRAHVFERGEPDARVLADGLAILDDSDLRDALPSLAMPSLWIAGRRDRLVPWQAMEAAALRAPGGRFVRIGGGGHAPFMSHAEETAEAVVDFLESVRDGSSVGPAKLARRHPGPATGSGQAGLRPGRDAS
jgi:pimeloyl-[acyl-carrier protein] methyl ester esterase